MIPSLTDETKPFWSVVHSKKKVYPYWCTTKAISPVASLVRIPHIRLTFGDEAYWGFKDSEKRADFMQRYPASFWSP